MIGTDEVTTVEEVNAVVTIEETDEVATIEDETAAVEEAAAWPDATT